jgi:NAD(P) transhydrogenase
MSDRDTARFDVIVIGTGPAGLAAAHAAARAQRRTLVVEKARGLGGECLHRGTIPSKTLRETALAFATFRRRSAHVVEVSVPEDVQVESLSQRLEQVTRTHERGIEAQLQRGGVAIWRGRAKFVGAHELEVTDPSGISRRAKADAIILATGSRPRPVPSVPIDHEHVLDSDSILSLRYLPRSLAVLGGGVIACEYSSIFAALGVQVTLIDRAERPLPFCDPEIVARFERAFEVAGGKILRRAEVVSVAFDGFSSVQTRLASGDVVVSEKVLCALGRVAAVDGLDLHAGGLALGPRGHLVVDAHGRTSVPGVYAAGDLVGPPSLASSSADQGRRAARHALGLHGGPVPELAPMGIYTIPEIASVGLSEADARARFGNVLIGRARFEDLARGQIAAIEDGMLKLVCDASGRRLLGAQMVGEGATELVHVAQMALAGRLEIDTFVENVFNFPTLAEAYRVAALEIIAQRDKLAQRPSLSPQRAALAR